MVDGRFRSCLGLDVIAPLVSILEGNSAGLGPGAEQGCCFEILRSYGRLSCMELTASFLRQRAAGRNGIHYMRREDRALGMLHRLR